MPACDRTDVRGSRAGDDHQTRPAVGGALAVSAGEWNRLDRRCDAGFGHGVATARSGPRPIRPTGPPPGDCSAHSCPDMGHRRRRASWRGGEGRHRRDNADGSCRGFGDRTLGNRHAGGEGPARARGAILDRRCAGRVVERVACNRRPARRQRIQPPNARSKIVSTWRVWKLGSNRASIASAVRWAAIPASALSAAAKSPPSRHTVMALRWTAR